MTTSTNAPARASSVARAFKPKDAFGQPRVFMKKADEDKDGNILDGQRFTMGVIYGRVDKADTKIITNPDGSTDEYPVLVGQFMAEPAREELPVIRTANAFVPGFIYDDIKETLERDGALSVEISFVVGIETKAKSSAGFVWTWDQKVETKAADPFAHLRAAALNLPAPEAPAQIEQATVSDAPEGVAETPAPEAPEGEEASEGGKGRRKR